MNPVLVSVLHILRQFVIVAIGFFILFYFFQCSLALTIEQKTILHVSGNSNKHQWTYELSSLYRLSEKSSAQQLNAHQAYQAYIKHLQTAEIGSKIIAKHESGQHLEITVQDIEQQKLYRLNDELVSLTELEAAIAKLVAVPSLEPTKALSIADIKKADVKTPTRSKVSLPGFSYRQAFPEATDEPEYIISNYNEAPALKARQQLDRSDPAYLPPVTERLPQNPAVVWGPDGIGQYGGEWRQCTGSHRHLNTKMCTESFTRFDPSGNIQPCLAYKWEISDDLKTYTFYLRKGHKWSNGMPFTSHDIAFVCNVDIGSQRWSTPPDWMQATDGSKQISVLDVHNWDDFKQYLLSNDPFATYLSKRMLEKNVDIRQVLSLPDYHDAIVRSLNLLCADPSLYDVQAWPELDLESDLNILMQRGYHQLDSSDRELVEHYLIRNNAFTAFKLDPQTLSDDQLRSMNNMLLRLALPTYLRKPFKQRVIVSPVADETGDDTHIIRFEFPRPNPLFLERTATFMFYRGLFGMPKHFHAPYHYNTSQELAYFDVLNWNQFCNSMQHSNNPSITRIYNALRPETQQIIQNYQDEEGQFHPLGNEDQKIICKHLRDLFRQEAFFDQKTFESLDHDRLLSSVKSESLRAYNLSEWNRKREFMQLQSIANALHNQKTDITPEHISYYNTMCFRLSFAQSIVAPNREAGLNHIAGKQHKQYRTWIARLRDFGTYHPDFNPHPPVLQAWRIVTSALDRTMIAERNPYYYRVDIAGNQLPYLDRIVFQIEKEEQVRLLKLASGNVDFQTRDLNSNHWSVLKGKEYDGDYRVIRWANDYSGELNFFTLQTNKDKHVGPILQDKRFRYALSLGLNRQEMIDVFWQGLGTPAQCAVPEGSPFYSAQHNNYQIAYDSKRANELLDELGLHNKGSDGIRRLPNGKPIILNVHSRSPHLSKVIQMACNYWQQLGINAQMKQASGPAMNRSLAVGTLEIGVQDLGDSYFGPLLPARYAPSHPAECPQWFSWAQWYQTNGKGGTEPPDHFKQRKALWDKIVFAPSREQAFQTWAKLQDMTRDELPLFGVTTSPGQVVYIKNGFKNVPTMAMSGWIAHQPGNCCPEVFFKEDAGGAEHAH